MTNEELKKKALELSGLPPRKNKYGTGIGAYRWLANQLDVHPSTMARWIRGGSSAGSNIPQWVVDRIDEMERDRSAGSTKLKESA